MSKIPDGTRILAGDIGGTKTNLAIIRLTAGTEGERLTVEREARFLSEDHASLGAMIGEFLGVDPPTLACAGFGVPGPVKDGKVQLTNLSWGVDATEVAEEFHFPAVEVLNDVAANAYGISELQSTGFAVVQEGDSGALGNRCVVSPGTGLGEAGLFWDGHKHKVWACEGGHAGFAPTNGLEVDLFNYLEKLHGHVSTERVVSGKGMMNIYRFLRDTGLGKEKDEVRQAMETEDPGKVLSQFGNSGECPMCAQTLEIFSTCLAVEAGNMALKSMATGGVFLGGGIPAKMLSHLRSESFLQSFSDKGRMRGLMQSIPVRVILNDHAALLGAARFAADALDLLYQEGGAPISVR